MRGHLRIFNADGVEVSTTDAETVAASIVGKLGPGASVRVGPGRGGSKVVWHEGHESQPAAHDLDHAAGIMVTRQATAGYGRNGDAS